jgi:hypothetical protein
MKTAPINTVSLVGQVADLTYRASGQDARDCRFSVLNERRTYAPSKGWKQPPRAVVIEDRIAIQWWKRHDETAVQNGDIVALVGRVIVHEGQQLVRATRVRRITTEEE